MTREEALEYVNNMYMYEDTKNALETLIPEFGKTCSDKVIDHEDKYKEALLEARAVLEPCLKYSRGKVREALDSIDKELKSFESEDEMIRKELKEAFEAYDIESKWNGIPIRSIFAWLDKQKEPENTSASTMVPSCWAEEPSLQKEQEPEWSDEDEKMIKTIVGILECASQVTTYEQRGGSMSASVGYSDKYKEEIAWLSSLRPQKLDASKLENFDPVDVLNRIKTEWPMAWEKVVGKQEWNEEDEDMIQDIIASIDTNIAASDFHEMEAWLKSLRPSWKPSEEQIHAIIEALKYLPNNKDEWMVLNTLVDVFKKLI